MSCNVVPLPLRSPKHKVHHHSSEFQKLTEFWSLCSSLCLRNRAPLFSATDVCVAPGAIICNKSFNRCIKVCPTFDWPNLESFPVNTSPRVALSPPSRILLLCCVAECFPRPVSSFRFISSSISSIKSKILVKRGPCHSARCTSSRAFFLAAASSSLTMPRQSVAACAAASSPFCTGGSHRHCCRCRRAW